MKQVSQDTKDIWESGDFVTDARRPFARVTIAKMHMHLTDYRIGRARTSDWAHEGKFASALFGQESRPRELRNVKSIKWERGIDQDVGTCVITLYNVGAKPRLGPVNDEEIDRPGWYTPNRGTEDFFTRWGYEQNAWRNWLVPDRVIRTYEGYGFDALLPPERDPHMYPSGVWLIDEVDFSTAGLVTVTCRDMGRLLMDHICFPPVVPWEIYPLWFDHYKTTETIREHTPGAKWKLPKYHSDSNKPYVNAGYTDNGEPVCAPDGSVKGHHGRDAFDQSIETYWLSVGTDVEGVSSFRWVQGKIPNGSVEGVKVDVKGGSYRMWVSLQRADGTWVGRRTIPYEREDGEPDLAADIPYVASFRVERGRGQTFKLPKQYDNIVKIRYTFSDLWNSGIGYHFKYRVGVQRVMYAASVTEVDGKWRKRVGNYYEYTDVVKWLAAWGGFHWPRLSSGQAFQTLSDGSTEVVAPNVDDLQLQNGRVWGDLMRTGTAGVVKLDVDFFDKKPLMDGIAAIRDIVGFDFHVDETGGIVFRMPNVWRTGNYLMPAQGGERSTRTQEIVEIDEERHLLDMGVTLSSRNVRERVFIGNLTGHKGSVVRGYNPAPSGMRRVGGWTDQRFATNKECRVMADLVALKQMFTYRENRLTIPGHPALQIDDQVRIYERQTGEGYLHRITGISSEMDFEEGRWTYSLTTHWLGEKGLGEGRFDALQLDKATKRYLKALGVLG